MTPRELGAALCWWQPRADNLSRQSFDDLMNSFPDQGKEQLHG